MMEFAASMCDDVEMKMYDVYHMYKCMMYIKRSVYKWALGIETRDWGCHRAVEFYQNLPGGDADQETCIYCNGNVISGTHHEE